MTFFAILRKNLYSEHVLDMLLHYYATKAVEGNDTRPSTGVGQVELARHYFKIIYIGYFSGVVHRRVRKPSTDSVNPLSSLYKYKVNVLLTIRNGNVLKEQNFTCTLIPCTTLGNLDFMDLVKKKQ